MVNPWKSAIHAVKWTTGIKSITGRVKADQLAVSEAKIVETQVWMPDPDQLYKHKWTTVPPNPPQGVALDLASLAAMSHDTSCAAFSFENGGATDSFPTDKVYMARLSEGFSFGPKTSWTAGEWVEVDTQPNANGRAATRIRQRKWTRALDYKKTDKDATTSVSLQSKTRNSLNASNTADTMAALGLSPITKQGSMDSPVPAPRHRTASVQDGSVKYAEPEPESPAPERESQEVGEVSAKALNTHAASHGIGVGASSPFSAGAGLGVMSGGNLLIDQAAKFGPEAGTTEFAPADPVANKMHRSYDVTDARIAAIGKQILKLEHESVKWFEEQRAIWKKEQLPVIDEQARQLEVQLETLKSRLGDELDISGLDHAKKLEEEIAACSDSLEDVKRSKYFPHSKVALGAEGYYVAFDDLWLEHLVGCIAFELQPSKTMPFIRLFLAGDSGSVTSGDIHDDSDDPIQQAKADDVPPSARKGLEVRFKLEKLMTNGDKGTSIPKISLDTIKVTLELRVKMKLVYDAKKETWECSKDQLLIELMAFRGPFGTRKSMITALLPIIKPMIRQALIKALPKELGSFISTLPSPLELKGAFSIKGTPLQVLKDELGTHEYVRKACNLSVLQLGMFKCLNNAMGRSGWSKMLGNVSDLLTYMAKHKRNGKLWRSICALWEEASELYCEQIIARKRIEAKVLGQHVNIKTFTFKFVNVLRGAEEVARKRIHVQVSIHRLEGQASVNKALRYLTQFLYRLVAEEGSAELKRAKEEKDSPRPAKKGKEASLKASSVKRAKTILMLNQINKTYENGLEAIKMLCRNFDFAETKIALKAATGPEGSLKCVITKLFAQFPLLLDSRFDKDKQIWGTLVPFKVGVRPQASGDVMIELLHVLGLNIADLSASSEVEDEVRDVTVLGITARKPHVSIIVDQKSTLKAGAELFSLMIGPRTSGKKLPFGVPDMMQGAIDREEMYRTGALQPLFASGSEFADFDLSLEDRSESKHDPLALELTMDNVRSMTEMYADESIDKKGIRKQSFHEVMMKNDPNSTFQGELVKAECPLFLQTAPGIKMLLQVPKINVLLAFPAMMKFLAAHFKDLSALKEWLEDTFGGNFVGEQLFYFQTVLVCIAKYLIMPGMSAELNLNIKVITQSCEIMVRLQTPEHDLTEADEEALRSMREESSDASDLMKTPKQSGDFAVSRARSSVLNDRGSLATETNAGSMYQADDAADEMLQSLASDASISSLGRGAKVKNAISFDTEINLDQKRGSLSLTPEELSRQSFFQRDNDDDDDDDDEENASANTPNSTHTTATVKNAISFDTEIVIDQSKSESSFHNAALISNVQSAVYIPKSKGKRPSAAGSFSSGMSDTSSQYSGYGYREPKVAAISEQSEMASVAESDGPYSSTLSDKEREKELRPEKPCAMKLDIAFNVMDLVDDSAAIAKAMADAKSAATENAIEQAEKLLRKKKDHEASVMKHMNGER